MLSADAEMAECPRCARPRTRIVSPMNRPIVALVVLSLVPLLSGLSRVFDVSTGLLGLDGHERYSADPLPAVIHMLGATAFATLGALQFVPSLRQGNWHRWVGRGLAVGGVAAAVAGVWMTLTWPHRPSEGPSLDALRVVVASAIVTCIVASVVAIRRKDVPAHQAWMTRAYALWAGGGTQAFTLGPLMLEAAAPWRSEGLTTALYALGWLINLAVAEWSLRPTGARAEVVS